jgi:hypothetical protein
MMAYSEMDVASLEWKKYDQEWSAKTALEKIASGFLRTKVDQAYSTFEEAAVSRG